MLYPLSSVHTLIYEVIHPESISNGITASPSTEIWKQVQQEIEASRLHLYAQLSQASGSDSLKVIVYTCQAGYISIIKRLGCYISQEKMKAQPDTAGASLCGHYKVIRKLLVSHLLELYNQYLLFFLVGFVLARLWYYDIPRIMHWPCY